MSDQTATTRPRDPRLTAIRRRPVGRDRMAGRLDRSRHRSRRAGRADRRAGRRRRRRPDRDAAGSAHRPQSHRRLHRERQPHRRYHAEGSVRAPAGGHRVRSDRGHGLGRDRRLDPGQRPAPGAAGHAGRRRARLGRTDRGREPDFFLLRRDPVVVAVLLALVAGIGFMFAVVDDWLDRRMPRATFDAERGRCRGYAVMRVFGGLLFAPDRPRHLPGARRTRRPSSSGSHSSRSARATLAWWVLRIRGRTANVRRPSCSPDVARSWWRSCWGSPRPRPRSPARSCCADRSLTRRPAPPPRDRARSAADDPRFLVLAGGRSRA